MATGRRLGSAVCVLASDSACVGGMVGTREVGGALSLARPLHFLFGLVGSFILLTGKWGVMEERARSCVKFGCDGVPFRSPVRFGAPVELIRVLTLKTSLAATVSLEKTRVNKGG